MAVYVDKPFAQYRRMIMCHMAADTIEELHAMADSIGIDRKHYQGPPVTKWPHYDICKSKRDLAVKLGAIEVTMREILFAAKRSKEA